MYSFQPLAPVEPSHVGFFIMIVAVAFVILHIAVEWRDSLGQSIAPAAAVLMFTYCVSYVWTDQSTKVYDNKPVVGTFVQFNPEALVERSGKSTTTKHLMYVTYNINGEHVILPAVDGVSYPARAVLYKN